MHNTLVNLNGSLQPGTHTKISVFDRGFIYGDSLYEVMRTYNGKLFQIDEHMERLQNSARLMRFKIHQPIEELKSELQKTVSAYRAQQGSQPTEVYCRLIVTRGIGRIGFGLPAIQSNSQFLVIVQDLPLMSAEKTDSGLHMVISGRVRNNKRALDPAIKSGNYLNNLLAYLEAEHENYDDALLCDGEGFITEGTTFNVFYVRKGIVATPPLSIGILDGITRRTVLRVLNDKSVEVREVRFPRERLYEADEVFISSTLKDIFPVTQLDRKKIGNGKPGPLTQKFLKFYQEYVRTLQ